MLNRRQLIRSGAVTVAVFSGLVPGLRATAQTLRIRENITDLKDDGATLRSLRQFVAEMRSRPASKVPNWTSLHDVHGSVTNGFNLCQHRNWYLFPWHRAYIEMYENMVRDLTGNQGFAMPYWDWSALRTFPPAFTVANADGKPNSLLSPAPGDDAARIRNAEPELDDTIVGLDKIRQLLAEPNFEIFGSSRPSIDGTPQDSLDPKWLRANGGTAGAIEAEVHNKVHIETGGPLSRGKPGYMSTAESARDPIFLAHHTNFDRLWASWRGQNPDDTLWRDMVFPNHFYKLDGSRYSVKVSDLLDIRSRGYSYRNLEQVPLRGPSRDTRRLLDPVGSSTGDARVRVVVPADTTGAKGAKKLQFPPITPASSLGTALRAGDDLYAVLRDMTLSPGVTGTKVYLNLPTIATGAPEEDPHLVANLVFLPGAHHGHAHDVYSASLNLGPTLRRLASMGELRDDSLSLQLIPVYADGLTTRATAGTVIPRSVDIGIP